MNKLKEQVKDYLKFIEVEKGLSANTLQAYQQDLMEFVDFLVQEDISFWPAEVTDINAFLARQSKNKAASSVSRMISSLNRFYQWLARQDIQKLNPMLEIDAPKKEVKEPVVLSEDEVAALFEQIDINKNAGKRDRAILATFYVTGIKASELINLKISDIHQDLQLIRVFDGNKARLVPITMTALNWIKEYIIDVRTPLVLKKQTNTDYLFLNNRGSKITRQAIWQIIKRYCKAAGLSKDITPHTFRHTFIAQMLKNGADLQVIQEILGYTDNNPLYKAVSQKKILQVYQEAHPRI